MTATSREKGGGIPSLLRAVGESLSKKGAGIARSDLFGDSDVGVWLPSGSLALDYILGGRGYPSGRVVEIFGSFSSGKSVLGYSVIASVQRLGGAGLLLDSECAYTSSFGAVCGVREDAFARAEPDTVEATFEATEAWIKRVRSVNKKIPLVVVWDSLAATSTRKELERDMDTPDLQKAKLMSQGMRKITHLVKKEDALFIVINQTRQKIGVMFGNPETTPGGMAVPFHSSVRVRLQMRKKIQDAKKNTIGVLCGVRTVKNKTHPPFQEAEIKIMFHSGLDPMHGLLEALERYGAVERVKGKYLFDGRVRFPGESGLARLIEKVPAVMTTQKLVAPTEVEEEEAKDDGSGYGG